MVSLREALTQAGAYAMHLRSTGAEAELFVLPVGIEVVVAHWYAGDQRRAEKRLIGWDSVEQATSNVLIATLDELNARTG